MSGASRGKGGFGSSPASKGAGNIINIELQGTDGLIARFKQYRAGLELAGGAVSYRVAQSIAEVAADLVAVDTGMTRANIKAMKTRGGASVSVSRGGERDEVPAYLELGTYKMAARPFLKPAGQMAMAAGATMKAIREVGGLLNATGGIR